LEDELELIFFCYNQFTQLIEACTIILLRQFVIERRWWGRVSKGERDVNMRLTMDGIVRLCPLVEVRVR
jgi:hypothetical protein